MSAFATGWCAMAAICCGLDWLKGRKPYFAIAFWLNIIFATLNAYLWLAA